VVLIQQERWVHDVSYARSVATIDVVQHVFFMKQEGLAPLPSFIEIFKKMYGFSTYNAQEKKIDNKENQQDYTKASSHKSI
jgi:hypothetical protein